MKGARSKPVPYPTARDAGTGFPLTLSVGNDKVYGESVPKFLIEVLRLADRSRALSNLELPFHTSGENFLLAASPIQKDGRPFSTSHSFNASDGRTIYINTNHPRFFALRQGARILEAVGLTVSYKV